jgi:hypothetical protein
VLEGKLDAYSDDEAVDGPLDILASYRPGGGEFFYNQERLKKEIESVLRRLNKSA